MAKTKSSELKKDVVIPKAVANLLESMGVELPSNMKEIEDVPVEQGEDNYKIIIPKTMSKLEAAEELKNQYKNEETKFDFYSAFEGWNWKDVLIAVKRVTEREFGWMNGQKNWYGGNPVEIDIVVDIKGGKHVSEKAFYGDFSITGWEDASANLGVRFGQANLTISAKKKYEKPITAYFNMIREQLETNSIYRGRNIVVTGNESQMDFEIIENKISDKIVLNEKTQAVIDTFVMGNLGDPGKRCYLFAGGYGNAKTETAMHVGYAAVEKHNMSFFYLKDAKIFDTLLNLSKKYQPCVIFLEDVDEITAREERDAEMNKILNTLDGVQTKGNNLTVIFTTNHPEKINMALRRPGRIDLMLLFENPDSNSRKKILQLYLDKIKGSESLNYEELSNQISNVSGAVVAEIAKRAVKLGKDKGSISDSDVLACIASMEYQVKLMEGNLEVPDKNAQFVKLFAEVLGEEIFGEDIKLPIASMKRALGL
jgi:AAA+ superfamily predicted ATPase